MQKFITYFELGVVCGFALLFSHLARADFTLCNYSSQGGWAAYGYPQADGGLTTAGWLRLEPRECKVAAKGNSRYTRFRYYFESDSTELWSGTRTYCVVRGSKFHLRDAGTICESKDYVGFATAYNSTGLRNLTLWLTDACRNGRDACQMRATH